MNSSSHTPNSARLTHRSKQRTKTRLTMLLFLLLPMLALTFCCLRIPDAGISPSQSQQPNTVIGPATETNDSSTPAGQDPPQAASSDPDPVPTPLRVATNEDQPSVIELSNSHPGVESLAYIIDTLPNHGTLQDDETEYVIASNVLPYSLAADGSSVTYTPESNYFGQDSFSFQVVIQGGENLMVSVTITVNSVNDPPTITQACPLILEVEQNSHWSDDRNRIILSAEDPDPEADGLSWQVVSPPAHGAVNIQGSPSPSAGPVTIGYQPDTDYFGQDTYEIAVTDGQEQADTCVIQPIVGGYLISGTVLNHVNRPFANVPIILLGIGDSAGVDYTTTTDAFGQYAQVVPFGWSGTSGNRCRAPPRST